MTDLLHYFRLLTPLILDENYVRLKNEVIRAERRLLKELGFCVHVQHPHKVSCIALVYFDEQFCESLHS